MDNLIPMPDEQLYVVVLDAFSPLYDYVKKSFFISIICIILCIILKIAKKEKLSKIFGYISLLGTVFIITTYCIRGTDLNYSYGNETEIVRDVFILTAMIFVILVITIEITKKIIKRIGKRRNDKCQ